MRSAFIGSVLCAFAVCACGAAYGGEEASVLVKSEPAPAVVASSCDCTDCTCYAAPKTSVRTRTRYRVVNEGCDACTGRPVRSVARGVVRGTGEAVTTVGGVALDVITLPARVCRGGRCN